MLVEAETFLGWPNVCKQIVNVWYDPQKKAATSDSILLCALFLPAVDVWSIACIFAEIVTGQRLFIGKDRIQTLAIL